MTKIVRIQPQPRQTKLMALRCARIHLNMFSLPLKEWAAWEIALDLDDVTALAVIRRSMKWLIRQGDVEQTYGDGESKIRYKLTEIGMKRARKLTLEINEK